MSKYSMKTEFVSVLFMGTAVTIMDGQHFFSMLSKILAEMNGVELNSVVTQAFVHICISRLCLGHTQ